MRNFTLKDTDDVPELGSAQSQVSRAASSTYDQFLEYLLYDLDQAAIEVEKQRNELAYANATEDIYTIVVIAFLRGRRYQARHGTNHGGSVDIDISKNDEDGDLKYQWIGEAKKCRNVRHPADGFEQLITRYTTGRIGSNNGGVLCYVVVKNAAPLMKRWFVNVQKMSIPSVKLLNIRWCDKNVDVTFFTEHKNSNGLKFTTRHQAFLLHHEPNDNAARSKKVRAKKRSKKLDLSAK